MSDVAFNRDQRIARGVVERLTMAVINAAAVRRQGIGRGNGARSPAGLAQDRRTLGIVSDPRTVEAVSDDGRTTMRMRLDEMMTPVGYKTARGTLPPVLAMLPQGDPRLRAAIMFADTVERIDSVKGADIGGDGAKGVLSDGGATTKVKHAARFNRVRDAVNGWTYDDKAGRVVRDRERVVLRVRRRRSNAQDIKAFELLCAVCVDGKDMREILVSRGWSAQSEQRKALAVALLDMLDTVRGAIGIA
jgi:hypothetical protein